MTFVTKMMARTRTEKNRAFRTIWMVILAGCLIIQSGCRRDLTDLSIESELLTPLVHGKLSILEIVPDSLRKTGNDGSVSLVYRNEIYSSALGSFQPLETREFQETARLQSLTLGARSAVRDVSLGQIAAAEGGVLGQLIISQHGTNAIIPPINGLSYGPLSVDGTAFFESVILDSGFMDVRIKNEFPTGISNIEFEIRNQSDNSLVGTETFNNVAAGNQQTRTIDLEGKELEGTLLGTIINFDIDGTGTTAVPIDTVDKIIVTIGVRDMKVFSATAIFPSQDIISLADTNTMQNVGDLKLTKATAKTGTITVRVVSTVEDTLFFEYFVPEGKKNGVPLQLFERVDPAPSGGSIERVFTYPVDGYTFDLTGMPKVNHYNAFYSELTGRIDSTGKVVNLSLEDSILVFVKLSSFVPEYIEGYLGNTVVEVGPETAPLDLFSHFQSGKLSFEEVKVRLGVSNGNGVPFQVDVNTLIAENTRSGDAVALSLDGLQMPLEIQAASNMQNPWEGGWGLSGTNSNLIEALEILPNRLTVAMQIESNPDQNETMLQQFAVDSNELNAYLDIEVPLSFIAEDLVLVDTLAFDAQKIKQIDQISGGEFYLITKNSLPLAASMELAFLDPQGVLLARIQFSDKIEGSDVGADVNAVLTASFDREKIELVGFANRVVIRATVETTSGETHQQIWSDQLLEVTLSARFNYESAQ